VKHLSSLVRERDAEAARVRAGLARPEISMLTGQEEPGLEQARTVLARGPNRPGSPRSHSTPASRHRLSLCVRVRAACARPQPI